MEVLGWCWSITQLACGGQQVQTELQFNIWALQSCHTDSSVSPSILPSVPSSISFFPNFSLLITHILHFSQICLLPTHFVPYLLLKLLCIMYSVRNASLYETPSACKHPISLKTSSNDLWKYPQHFTESLSLVYSDVKLFVSRLGADTVLFVCKALPCTWDTSQ